MSHTAIWFPSDNTVVSSTLGMARQMIEGESADSSIGAELAGQIDTSAALHLIFEDGQRLFEMPLLRDHEAGGYDLPLIFDARVPGYHDLLRSVERLEITLDYDAMVPLTASLRMSTTEDARTVEQFMQAGRLMAPGVFEQARQNINPDDPDTQLFGEFPAALDFCETAIKELQLTREDRMIQLQLSEVDGLERLPHWLMKTVALAQHYQRSGPQVIEDCSGDEPSDQ